MIPKCLKSGWRHCVHRIGADELLAIKHIAVIWILGARARPQNSLALRALVCECLPAFTVENLFIPLIGKPSVGIGNFTHDAPQECTFARAGGGLEPSCCNGVDFCVNAADKKTGDAGDSAHVDALSRCLFQPRNVGRRHTLVGIQ